jgi:hypothetical protein
MGGVGRGLRGRPSWTVTEHPPSYLPTTPAYVCLSIVSSLHCQTPSVRVVALMRPLSPPLQTRRYP